MDERLKDLISKAVSRRSFLASAGSAAAVTVVAGCGGSSTPTATPTPTPTPTSTPAPTAAALTDADILTFALNLEYLEAEFYLRAATGSGLSAADSGNSTSTVTVPATTLVPNLTTAQKNYLYEIAQNELDHVRFLRSALTAAGATPVSRPEIDLLNSFNGAAMLAGIGPAFNPFASYEAFLVGAFVFEDVGVTAYSGAAGLLTNKAYLAAAASILAVEAYHAGEVRTLLVLDSVQNATTANGTVSPNNTYITYANQISALRASVGGGMETPITPLPPYPVQFDPTQYKPASSIVAASATNSVGFARTTDEVLHIVYATAPGAGVRGGGFFPSGLNGAISVTTK